MNGLQKVNGETYRQGGTLGASSVKAARPAVVIDPLDSGYVVSVSGNRVALTDNLALITHLVRHYYPEHMVEVVEIERLVQPRAASPWAAFRG